MAERIPAPFWGDALKAVCPPNHTYKLALYAEAVAEGRYSPDGECQGVGYGAGGQVLTGYQIVSDERGADLRFDRFVQWLNADIMARSALIYNATTNTPLSVIDFGRQVGVLGGLFEVKLNEAGVLRLGEDESGGSV